MKLLIYVNFESSFSKTSKNGISCKTHERQDQIKKFGKKLYAITHLRTHIITIVSYFYTLSSAIYTND